LRGVETTSSITWLGPTEKAILEAIYYSSIRGYFRLSDLRKTLNDLGYGYISSKALWISARRLVRKGILGYDPKLKMYFVIDPLSILIYLSLRVRDTRNNGSRANSVKRSKKVNSNNIVRGVETHGTRVFGVGVGVSVGGLGVEGPLFDNVRGYLNGRYVNGDRDRVLTWYHVRDFFGDPGDVSYCEVLYMVSGVSLSDGFVKIYTNELDLKRFGSCVRVEYIPSEGVVKRYGVEYAIDMAFHSYLKAWVALTATIIYVANQNSDYRKMFIDAIESFDSLKTLIKAL